MFIRGYFTAYISFYDRAESEFGSFDHSWNYQVCWMAVIMPECGQEHGSAIKAKCSNVHTEVSLRPIMAGSNNSSGIAQSKSSPDDVIWVQHVPAHRQITRVWPHVSETNPSYLEGFLWVPAHTDARGAKSESGAFISIQVPHPVF